MPSRRKTNKKFARRKTNKKIARRKTKGLKKGGGIIGGGSYGCVYKPALTCVGEQTDTQYEVSKLMETKDKEFIMIKIINEIDPLFLFHLNNRQCFPENNQNEIQKCKNLNTSDAGKLLLMNNGGMDLYKFAKFINKKTNPFFAKIKTIIHSKRMRTVRNVLLILPPPKVLIKEFYSDLLRIFYGIKKIKDRGYFHDDIKNNNIMVKFELNSNNKYDLRLNLIDFGLMKTFDEFRIYSPEYTDKVDNFIKTQIYIPYRPIDFLYFLGKDEFFFKKTQINHFNNLNIQNERVKNRIQNILNYNSIPPSVNIDKIIQSIDTYMLGMTMLIFSNKINLETHFSDELSYDLFFLFYGMMSYDYANRKTIEESIERFNEIINENQDFFNMNKIKKIREDFFNSNTVVPGAVVTDAVVTDAVVPAIVPGATYNYENGRINILF